MKKSAYIVLVISFFGGKTDLTSVSAEFSCNIDDSEVTELQKLQKHYTTSRDSVKDLGIFLW